MADVATPDNAEQLRRRANRRLLGASILLLIAIIAVPMFLEREPPPLPDNVDVRIPPVEGTKFEPKFPVAVDAKKSGNRSADKSAEVPAITEPSGAQAAVSGAISIPSVSIPAPVVATITPKAAPADVMAPKKPADPPAGKPAEKAAPKESTAVDRKSGQHVVQVIAARDPVTAKQLYDKAKNLKFPVYTEKIDVVNGVVIRVRVGPYATKQQAESARAKLAQAGFDAKVLVLQ